MLSIFALYSFQRQAILGLSMSEIKLSKLRRFNLVAAALHAGQGVAVLLLSKSFSLPVTASYLDYNSNSQHLFSAQHTLFSLSLPWLVAIFFFLSAAFHLAVGTFYYSTYAANLQKGINKARWFEYSLSAAIMMVAIAMLVGVYDFSSLLMILILVSIMNLSGLAMEIYNQGREKVKWLAYKIGSLAGLTPWLVVAIYFWATKFGNGHPPTFVYWIFVSIFIFFSCFALNMYLQYKRIGKWADYLYGERMYIWLSLIAKSLLAWQVFAGTLRP